MNQLEYPLRGRGDDHLQINKPCGQGPVSVVSSRCLLLGDDLARREENSHGKVKVKFLLRTGDACAKCAAAKALPTYHKLEEPQYNINVFENEKSSKGTI